MKKTYSVFKWNDGLWCVALVKNRRPMSKAIIIETFNTRQEARDYKKNLVNENSLNELASFLINKTNELNERG